MTDVEGVWLDIVELTDESESIDSWDGDLFIFGPFFRRRKDGVDFCNRLSWLVACDNDRFDFTPEKKASDD